jgi:flagellar M-ring protein FliF
MDFLNKTFAQVADLFRSMTLGARITSGLLLVVVVVSLGYLFTARISSPDSDLMHGLPIPASQLPVMEAAFKKAGLSGYEVRGTQILVPRGQRAEYMAALADAKALPPNFGSALREAMNAGSMTEYGKQKEQRVKVAIQEELSLIISSMSGIESAYVLYDTDIKYGINREKVTTASVSVKPAGAAQLDESRVSSIRHLVAGAIAGLKPENVTIADLNGRVYPGSGEGGGSVEDNLYLAATKNCEQHYKAKILNALCFIPNVTVEPTVVLNKERISKSKKTQYDPKPVSYSETEESTTRTREGGGGPGGRPGYQAQQPNVGATLIASRTTSSRDEEEESKRKTLSLASGEQVEKEDVGLTPKRIAVSVGIPSSYFEKVWRERNPAEEGKQPPAPDQAALGTIRQEVSADIKKHVAALLPPAEGVNDPGELVTVTTFQDIKPPKLPAPAVSQHALSWLAEYWGTLGMIGLALFSLVMLRSMIRSVLAPAPAAAMPKFFPEEAEEPEPPSPKAAAAKRLRRFQTSGRSLRDELSDMVQEDPDVAANILKSWIGHAG